MVIMISRYPFDPHQQQPENHQKTDRNFGDIDDSICPPGYNLELHEEDRKVIFYKMENNTLHSIPDMTATIVVNENMNVELYITRQAI